MRLDCDVGIIGAGPTGLTLANLLGAAGVRVVLVERNATTVAEPRAVSIDDEALRTIQGAGLVDAVLEHVALDYGSHYFSKSGHCFAKVEPTTREYGYPRRSAFSQPRLEATLRHGLARFDNVVCLFGRECVGIEEEAGGVTATLKSAANDEVAAIHARFLVGSDGARSIVRKAIGATMVGSTYQQRWLIIDLVETRDRFRQTRVVCDPGRPAISLPGPGGIRRYEFMLHADETDEHATSPAFVRDLLGAVGPDRDAAIARSRIYTFHARVADRWQSDRIFLAGDAAHLSPPFAGQGMNSGIRDADNLAWKLAEVVAGNFGTDLLRTYSEERRPHSWKLIRLAMAMGRVMMPTSRLQAGLTQAGFRAARIVPALHSYFAEMKFKPKPYFESGFFTGGDTSGLVGRMFPQPTLEMANGQTAKMDDVLGRNFALIAFGPDAAGNMEKIASANFPANNIRRLAVFPKAFNADMAISALAGIGRDRDGILTGRLKNDNYLLFLRPDRYVAAAAQIAIPDAIDSFAASVARLYADAGAVDAGVDPRRIAAE